MFFFNYFRRDPNQEPQTVILTLDGQDGTPFAPIQVQLPQAGDSSAPEIYLMTESKPTSRRRSIPPEFSSELEDKTTEEGDSVEMQIFVTGTPPPEVVWYKDEQPITIYPHRRFHATRENEICSLEIKDARCSDQGKYTCRAKNTAGEVRKSCNLTVKQVTPTSPPAFVKNLKDVYIVEGSCTRFDVKVTGMPEPHVTWYKDGRPVKEDKHMELVHDEDTSALILMYGKLEDAGDYICKASNEAGDAQSSAHLHISPLQIPAKFSSHLEGVGVSEGEPLKLKCAVVGKPDPNITWFKDQQQFEESERIKLKVTSDNTCILHILKSDMDDEGTYTCSATNSAGKDTTSAKVTVNGEGKAPEFTKVLENTEVPEGSPIRLEVGVQGKPTPFVEWLKGTKLLKSGPRFETQATGNTHIFFITHCRDDDGGIYTCKASNKFGAASCEATLVVAEDTVPPRFTKKLYDSTADAGNTVEFSVKYIGSPEPKVKWFLDDEEVSDDDEGMDIETEPGSSLLVLEDIAPNDSGQYKCIITNIAGKAVTSAQLKVVDEGIKAVPTKMQQVVESVPPAIEKEPSGKAPVFIKELTNVHVTEGDAVRLEVVVDGMPRPGVQWFVENDLVEIDEHMHIIEEGNKHALVIDGTVLDDEAEYKCVAKNAFGKVECIAELLVDEITTKPEFLKELKPVEVVEGSDVEFEVQVQGNPEPDVSWLRNNVLIEPGDRYEETRVEDVHRLIIHDTIPEDSGEVKCQAKNDVGRVQSVAQLVVKPNEGETSGVIEEISVSHTVEVQSEVPLEGVLGVPKQEKSLVPPEIVKSPQDLTVTEGDTARFEVEVFGHPAPDVEWFSNGAKIEGNVETLLESDGNIHRLVLMDVVLEDEGEYMATATSEVGKVSCTGKLSVKEKIKKPSFLEVLRDIEVTENTDVRLEVRVQGTEPDIDWYKNDAVIEEATSRTEFVENEERGSYAYLIYGATTEDQGTYRCTAVNEAGEVSCEGQLTVRENVISPRFLQRLEDKKVVEGSDVDFEVEVSGRPKPTLKWLKDNRDIAADDHIQIDTEGRIHTLTITKSRLVDGGTYSCVASNSGGRDSCSANLEVEKEMHAPEFVVQPQGVQIVEGGNARFEAVVSGLPEPEIEWVKDGKLVRESYRFKLEYDGNRSVLTVKDAKQTDDGEFTCTATNKVGKVSCTIELVVDEAVVAPEFLKKMNNIELCEGDLARFDVRVSGTPQPDVKWLKNDKTLEGEPRFEFLSDDDMHSLELTNCLLSDAGTYRCIAANEAGQTSCSADLTVTEKPTPPVFTDEPSFPSVIEDGGNILLEATVSGKPAPTVEWVKDDATLKNSSHLNIKAEDDKHTLTIVGAGPGDSGAYKCIANNPGGTTTRTFNVNIEGENCCLFAAKLFLIEICCSQSEICCNQSLKQFEHS